MWLAKNGPSSSTSQHASSGLGPRATGGHGRPTCRRAAQAGLPGAPLAEWRSTLRIGELTIWCTRLDGRRHVPARSGNVAVARKLKCTSPDTIVIVAGGSGAGGSPRRGDLAQQVHQGDVACRGTPPSPRGPAARRTFSPSRARPPAPGALPDTSSFQRSSSCRPPGMATGIDVASTQVLARLTSAELTDERATRSSSTICRRAGRQHPAVAAVDHDQAHRAESRQ